MLLEFEHIELRIKERLLFKSEPIQLTKGLVALVGRNGTGKSTFLNTIVDIRHDLANKIIIHQRKLSEYNNRQLSKVISVVYSKSQVFGEHTVNDVLLLGRTPYLNPLSGYSKADREMVSKVSDLLGIQSLREQNFNALSDGERQMVMLGRALVQDTDIIVLDEPTAFLDVVNKQRILELLAHLSKSKLILFSSHQVGLLVKLCDQLLLIDQQRLNLYTQPTEFQEVIENAFQIQL